MKTTLVNYFAILAMISGLVNAPAYAQNQGLSESPTRARLLRLDLAKRNLNCENSSKPGDTFRVISCASSFSMATLVGAQLVGSFCKQKLKAESTSDSQSSEGNIKVSSHVEMGDSGVVTADVSITQQDDGTPRHLTNQDILNLLKSCVLEIATYQDSIR